MIMSAGTANFFVYCDLPEHVMVGDIKAPLLHIVNRKIAVSQVDDKVEHTAFHPIQYMPLQKKVLRYKPTSYWRRTMENRCR